MSKIRILVADDHAVLRAGLAVLLNAQTDLEVVGEAADGLEAIRKAQELKPDVVVMDISMPGIDGLEAIRHLKERMPLVKPLVLTMHEGEEFLFRALQAGASGYVLKRSAHTDLIEAIRTVCDGDAFLYPSAIRLLVKDYLDGVKEGSEHDSYDGLTDRQREVLGLVAQGYTNQEIANRLVVSVKTVEKHKADIMEKLDIRNRAGLVKYALRKGLLTADL
ncbi:MAG: response regulator transcription factor [Chloroflexi bacterium]|nr:response regulator transcription factor [Chloroflexota bacterium]